MSSNSNVNLKLYPKYRSFSMDFLFFYTINVLFLTQIKQINMSAVVLVDTFYALFVLMVQVPSSFIIEKIGRKRSMILGNIFNALYLIFVINSTCFLHLAIAEIFAAMGFSLKDISEPAILNESIELDKKNKSNLFAKIQSQAVSGYYGLSAISLVVSGFLYDINGYIPVILSLCIVIITLILSTRFEEKEIITKKNKEKSNKQIKENYKMPLKEVIKFVFLSKRCRCLLIFSTIFYSIITILATYEITLLEDLGISSMVIGILFALLNVISSISSKKQEIFQNKFKNKTLTVLSISLSFSIIISGIISKLKINLIYVLIGIFLMYAIKYVMVGLYNVLLIKYLSNFTNENIDTKIFAVNNFLSSVGGVLFGLFASYLIRIMNISEAMIVLGNTVLVVFIILLKYMKNKVGLDSSNYSEYELQFDNKVK